MAKRSIDVNLQRAASILGKKGGPARARALDKKRRVEIATKGGYAKHAAEK
jgi:general stress protein YciG